MSDLIFLTRVNIRRARLAAGGCFAALARLLACLPRTVANHAQPRSSNIVIWKSSLFLTCGGLDSLDIDLDSLRVSQLTLGRPDIRLCGFLNILDQRNAACGG